MKSSNKNSVSAYCAVAHPDDCVIFAWPFIRKYSHYNWTIVYLTYNEQDERAQEAQKFWQQYDVDTVFLGHIDHYRDLEQGVITTFNTELAEYKLLSALQDADLILTHNADGDYGHIHHKFVHECIAKLYTPQVYFASDFNCDTEIISEAFDIEQWPIHKSVIQEFQDRHIGRYQDKYHVRID